MFENNGEPGSGYKNRRPKIYKPKYDLIRIRNKLSDPHPELRIWPASGTNYLTRIRTKDLTRIRNKGSDPHPEKRFWPASGIMRSTPGLFYYFSIFFSKYFRCYCTYFGLRRYWRMNCAAEMREAPLGLLAPPETPPTTIFRPLQLRCRFHSLFSSGSAFRKISVGQRSEAIAYRLTGILLTRASSFSPKFC